MPLVQLLRREEISAEAKERRQLKFPAICAGTKRRRAHLSLLFGACDVSATALHVASLTPEGPGVSYSSAFSTKQQTCATRSAPSISTCGISPIRSTLSLAGCFR